MSTKKVNALVIPIHLKILVEIVEERAPTQESESTIQDSSTYYTRDSTEGSRDYEEKDSFVSEQRYASPVVATSAAVPEPVVEESQDGHVSQDDNESSSGSSSASYSGSSGSSSGSTMDPVIQGAVAAVAIPAVPWTFLIL